MARANRPPHPGSDQLNRARTRPFAVHWHNPPGAKLLRKAYRVKHARYGKAGVRIDTYKSARNWYLALR